MIEKNSYNKLKKLYGDISSWAIWVEPDTTPKSNTSDMSVFYDKNIYEKLNSKYIFVGLNAAGTHGERKDGLVQSWTCFHSDYKFQNDYKLRYALMNTEYWGSYITDIIKRYPEVESSKVRSYLTKHPEIIEFNIKEFIKEINLINTNPILIAMGCYTYELLNKHLGDKYKIIKIKHYASRMGKEKYREDVLNTLKEYLSDEV